MIVKPDLKHFVSLKIDHLFDRANQIFDQMENPDPVARIITTDIVTMGFDSFRTTKYNSQNLSLITTILSHISIKYHPLPTIDSKSILNLFLNHQAQGKSIQTMRLFSAALEQTRIDLASQIGQDYFQILNALIKADQKVNPMEIKLLKKYHQLFSIQKKDLYKRGNDFSATGYEFIHDFLFPNSVYKTISDTREMSKATKTNSNETLVAPEVSISPNHLKVEFDKAISEISNLPIQVNKPQLEKSLKKLHNLIGLINIKKEVLELINLICVNKMRSANKLKSLEQTLHLAFLGNPGTGKTTIARILTEIFYALGLLKPSLMTRNAVQRKIEASKQKDGLSIQTSFDHIISEYVKFPVQTNDSKIEQLEFESVAFYEKQALSRLKPAEFLIEVDKSGLIAAYLGQTSIKTRKTCEAALGGVLFIDEAYALSTNDHSSNNNQYGDEAIAVLLKYMEDNRKDIIVIVAGYPELMDQFLKSNPGLQSRFNKQLQFDDYSPVELLQIFLLFADEFQFKIENDARDSLLEFFRNKVNLKDEHFGNARLVRNIFEKACQIQASRIIKEANITEETLTTITAADIEQTLLNFTDS